MDQIILYGSQYGSTRRYAEKLSEQSGIPAVSYKDAPALAGKRTIVYLGGLYAGGALGLAKSLRGFSPQAGQKLLLVTVGLADPKAPENREKLRASLQGQLPAALLARAKLFHLRGGIDYQKLSFAHRTVMKLLYHSLRKKPLEQQTAEDLAFLESYGKQVDFTDFAALEPILQAVREAGLCAL